LRAPSSTPFPYTTLFRSPGQECIDRHAGILRDLTETPVLQFVLDKNVALIGGQFIERLHNRGPEDLAKHRILRCVAEVGENFLQDRKSTRLNSSHVKISY